MVLAISEVRRVVERVCARRDVIDACANRDLGFVIGVLNADGLTQGQMATEIELSGFDDVGVARRVVVTGLAGGATAEV